MVDACVVGHVTKDIIRVDGATVAVIPGGTAYYSAMALRSFGMRVTVVTKVAREDRSFLLSEMEDHGISVRAGDGGRSTCFENCYTSKDRESRLLRLRSVADPFNSEDLGDVRASVIHLGPLTSKDFSCRFLNQVSERARLVSMDVQGFTRPADLGTVTGRDWQEKTVGLVGIDILKADAKESLLLTGMPDPLQAARSLAGLGPSEVIITLGSKGSLIYANGQAHRIPAHSAKRIVDPTGCGDTYAAGYVYRRMMSADAETAGRFAALVSSLKLERSGPLTGRFLREMGTIDH
jgi:sugar/nucleoside kinase (ribokinase family)